MANFSVLPPGKQFPGHVSLQAEGIVSISIRPTPGYDFTAGGGGGGLSLYDLTPEIIDLTDGSWTLEDPDSLVQGVSFSSGFNTVTWNALAVGSADYRWASGTTVRAPRWYKTLQIDGNNITNGDYLITMVRTELDLTIRDFYQRVVCGTCLDPLSTDANVIDGMYGTANLNTTGNPAYGVITVYGLQSNIGATIVANNATIARGYTHMGAAAYINFDATDTATHGGSRNGVASGVAASVTVKLLVGVGIGANTTTVAAGNQQRFKLSLVNLTTDSGA